MTNSEPENIYTTETVERLEAELARVNRILSTALSEREDMKLNLTVLQEKYEYHKKQLDQSDARLTKAQNYLHQIQLYDETVRQVIDSDDEIKKAWKAFRVLYTLKVDDDLVDTARDKVFQDRSHKSANKNNNVCSECHLPKYRDTPF